MQNAIKQKTLNNNNQLQLYTNNCKLILNITEVVIYLLARIHAKLCANGAVVTDQSQIPSKQ